MLETRFPPPWLLLVTLVGCDAGGAGDSAPAGKAPEAPAALIDEEASQHSFGLVIGDRGLRLTHRYPLRNPGPHDIKITNVVNRKPCCGLVKLGQSVLRPGESTEVEVELVVGDKIGEVVHQAVIETEPPSPRELVLQTTARSCPPIRVEESGQSAQPHFLHPGERRQVEFQAFAYGTPARPPVDLDQVDLTSRLAVHWAGPKESGPAEDGLTVATRRFTATLDPGDCAGVQAEAIVLKDRQGTLHSQALNWEVLPRITASPRMVVVAPGKRDYAIVVQSRDETPFRITRIDLDAPGVRGTVQESGSALRQTVRIEIEGKPAGRTIMKLISDHPRQGIVEVLLVVL